MKAITVNTLARPLVARSEAALDESVASYRHSVLVAFAEVEDNYVSTVALIRSLGGGWTVQ